MVHVDAGVDAGEIAPPEEARDVGITEADVEQLPPGNHTGLLIEERL